MKRFIEVKVYGDHIVKSSRNAGVQHEANANELRLIFDDCWDGYAKKVTWWDALGNNPVERTLTVDLLENAAESMRIYLVPIPGEAMTEAGMLTYVIDGYVDGKRQRSIADQLQVNGAPFVEDADEPIDPTPTQAEQLQREIEAIGATVQQAFVARNEAKEAAEIAGGKSIDAHNYAMQAQLAERNAKNSAEDAAVRAADAANSARAAKASEELVLNTGREAALAAVEAAGYNHDAQEAADLLRNARATSYNLPAGSVATASLLDGVFQFGIPVGAPGEPGPQGEPGPHGVPGEPGVNGLSIGRVVKISGTGEAGTTDVYGVNLTNGSEVGRFSVYNGKDGAGGGTGGAEIFWATYGTTTNADIYVAHNEGKIVMLKKSSLIYQLATTSGSTATFVAVKPFNTANSDVVVDTLVNKNNTWSTATVTINLSGKQDVITDLTTIRANALDGAAALSTALDASTAAQEASTLATTASNLAIGADTRAGLIESDVSTIKGYIPSGTSSSNQLADKAFVNSSVSALETDVNANTSARHSHSNKSVLDAITSNYVGAWNTASTNSHTHANKSVLDAITVQKATQWDAKQNALTAGNGIKIENNVISLDITDGNGVSY